MKKCITIDRQYGSGGREVAKLLSQRLDIPFYDNDLLMIAAEKFGLNPGVVKEHDEKKNGSLLYNIAIMTNGMQYERAAQPYQIFQAECDTIKRLAENGPCIFIGRCADYALNDKCRTLNLFIYASEIQDRIQRAKSVDKVETKNIERYIKQKDMGRKTYYNSFTQREWGELKNYDMCLNTSKLGYEGCVDVIERIYNK